MVPKLLTWSIYLEGLGPIVQNNTKTNNLEPLNNTLRGFAAFQVSLNDTLRGVWAFQGPLNDTSRRRWAFRAFLSDTLRGLWAFQACLLVTPQGWAFQASLNDTLRGVRAHFLSWFKIEPKCIGRGVAPFFFL